MIRHLKTAKPETERADDDAKVRKIVEDTLADIQARGDTAVRELAEKFDNYSPKSYRLSEEEIAAIVAKVSPKIWRISICPGTGAQFCANSAGFHAGCGGGNAPWRDFRP